MEKNPVLSFLSSMINSQALPLIVDEKTLSSMMAPIQTRTCHVRFRSRSFGRLFDMQIHTGRGRVDRILRICTIEREWKLPKGQKVTLTANVNARIIAEQRLKIQHGLISKPWIDQICWAEEMFDVTYSVSNRRDMTSDTVWPLGEIEQCCLFSSSTIDAEWDCHAHCTGESIPAIKQLSPVELWQSLAEKTSLENSSKSTVTLITSENRRGEIIDVVPVRTEIKRHSYSSSVNLIKQRAVTRGNFPANEVS